MLNPAVNRNSVSSRTRVAAAALLACLSLSVAAVRAGKSVQSPPAPLAASTDDRSAGVLPGVSLTAPDAEQGRPTATFSASGRSESPSVAPGTRVLEATPAGLLTPPLAASVRAGQSAPAPLVGSIYDATGGVMPGVDVTLQDAQQGTWTATTNARGRFEFPSVAPGNYVLEAKLAGFRTLRQDIALRTAGDWDRAITLQVGELSEKIIVSAERVAAPTGASQAPPAPLRVGGNIRAPRRLHHVEPVYPASMREAGREGVVTVEAVIDAEGSVASARVLSADVHPDFAIAAVDAVRQWKYDPTLLNGVPVEVRMTVSVEFTLSK